MDPSAGILIMAIIGIVIAGPYLIEHIDETGIPKAFLDVMRLAFMVLIVAVLHVVESALNPTGLLLSL